MATIKKENLTPVLRNYIELKEREEKKKAESEKTPLMKYMEKAKESGTLLSSADMHEGEDVKMYAQRVKGERLKQEMERRVRDVRYKNAQTDITYDQAAETSKNMAFTRNMPLPTAADRLKNREGVKYTAPQTSVDYVPFAPENVRQRLAAAVGGSDLAQAKQEEAGREAERARIAAARPVDEVYADLDRLKEKRNAFEKTEAANDIADAINDLNMQEQKELLEANRITNKSQDEVDSIRADIRKRYEALRKDLENSGEYEGLNRDKRLLERELRDSYGKIKNNADFAELSQYKSTENAVDHYRNVTQSGVFAGATGYDDWVYEYINKNPEMLAIERESRAGMDVGRTTPSSTMGYDLGFLQSMTDDEIGIYNYIYAKEGKKEAEKYLDHIESDLYARQRADSEERFSDFAKNHKALASMASVAINTTKGAAYLGQALDRLINGDADPNAPYNAPVYNTNAIRNTVSQQVEEKWGPVASFGYQTAMSMADFLTAAGMSGGTGLSLFIMGSGAAADTTLSALERGVDSDSALALGAIAGFAEALTEKLSVDALLKGDWTKKTLGYIVKNMFAEGSEEAASTFINTMADILISKDKSEWQVSVQAYMDEGYSEKEAFRHTLFDNMAELGLDALGGAVSGALIGGGRAAIGKMGEAAANEDEKYRQLETVRRAVGQDTAKRADEIRAREGMPNMVLPRAGEAGKPIILPKAGNTDTDSETGKIVSGMEKPKPRLMTYSEKRLEDRIRNAETTAEHSGLRLGVNEKDIKVAKTLSERIGRDIVFYSDTSADGKKVNGYFDPDTNTIYINKDRSAKATVSFVLGHELTHTLEGTEAYRELVQRVSRQLTRDGVNIPKKLEEIVDFRKRAGKPLNSYEEAGGELTADYVGEKLLGSRAAIMELARENPSLAHKLKNSLDRFMMKIAGTEDYAAFDFIAKAQKFLEEAEKEAQEAEKAKAKVQAETKLPAEKTAPASGVNTEAADAVSVDSATDMNVGSKGETKTEIAAKPMQSDTAASGRTTTETKEIVARETVAEEKDSSETLEDVSDKPLPTGWAEYRETIEARHDAGEMTDEEYDEAISYVEEAIDTGVPFSRAAADVEDIEGKIPAFLRTVGETLTGKTKADKRQYSVSDEEGRWDENKTFSSAIDSWAKDGMPEYESFVLGTTGDVLQGLGAVENEIYIDGDKIKNIIEKHSEMSLAEIKKIPQILKNPVLVLKSRNDSTYRQNTRLVIFGSVKAQDGRNIMSVLDLRPIDGDLVVDDMQKLTSAYTKDQSPAEFLMGSDVLYADKKGIARLLRSMDFEMPIELLRDGYIGSISYNNDVVNISGEKFSDIAREVGDTDGRQYSVSDEASEAAEEKQTLYNILPTQAMTKLKKAEEIFSANLSEMFTSNSEKGEPVNIDPGDIRAISSGYILDGAETSPALNRLFDKYKTAKSPGNNAYQYGQFSRLADQYENTLKAVKRFADSKKKVAAPKTTIERKHYTTEEAAKLFEAQRAARRELDRVKARAILTEEDKIAMGKVRRGEMSLGQLNPSEYNVDDIRAVLEAQTAFDEADKQIKVYRGEIKAGYMGEAEAALADIANWTDKAHPLAYRRETIDRNFRDIIKDKEKAEAFIRQYIKPLGKAEANRQKMIEDYRERVKALNLKEKPAKGEKVSESYAVQFLGEAEDNIRILEKMRNPDAVRDGKTLDEWKSAVETMWAENPSLDEAKIREGVKEFHKIYNELLDKMNEALLRNGYAPVRYRSGYFPHFTIGSEDAVLAKFSRLFGINLEVNPLPTSINGLTQDFKPGKTWFSHALERTGFETVYDAVAGFEQYIGGVSDVIWHTDNIQRFRALTSQIRWLSADEGLRQQVQEIENDDKLSEEQKQSLKTKLFEEGRYRLSNLAAYLDEYTNRLANKKSRADRGMEDLIGRKAYTVMNNLESRVASNMIGLNIGSALTNIIPLNQAQAVIGPMYTLRGMWDALQNLKNGDGLAAQSDFLVRRRGSKKLGMTTVEKISNFSGLPMELVDNFVSEAIVRAAYLKNLDAGMSEEAALEDADTLAASLMADRSKGALPLIFDVKNPLMKAFTQFQVEVNNEFSVIFKDIPRRFKEKGLAKLAAVLLGYFLGAKIFNDLYEKALGRRPAFDPIEMVNDAVGGLTGYQLPNVLDIFEPEAWNPGRENPADVITDFGTAAVESLPFVGGLFGGGRVPIQSAFPDVKRLINAAANNEWSRRKKTAVALEELANPLFYLAPPTMGGAIKKFINTAVAIAKGGVYGIADKKVDGIPVGKEELKYPLYMDTPGETAVNLIRSFASGTTTTPGGIEWVEGGFKSLSPKQTAAYEMLREFGVNAHDSWDLITSLREAEADIKDPANEKDDVTQAAVQRDILRNSNVSDEAKAAVYTALYVTGTKELELLESVSESGFTDTALALMDMKDIPSNASETVEKLRIIANTNLSYSDARKLYDLKIAGNSYASHDRIITNMIKAGIKFDDYLRARAEYTEINNDDDMDILEKTIAFDNWLFKNIRSPVHVSVMKENLQFKISMSVPASEVTSVKNYSIMTENGMSEETAHEVASAVSALKPLEGKTTVNAAQKVRAVLDTVSDDKERRLALEAVLKDDYRKYGIAHDLGVGFEVYTSFRETLPSYDEDGNNSYSQAEIVSAIESLTGVISPEKMIALLMAGKPIPAGVKLTNAQKAVIWQLATGSKSAKNNPYSTSAGNKVIEMLYPKE